MRKPWYGPEIGGELSKLTYPLYFADFETVNPAIPRFAGMRPYDQIPFQWSVHLQRQPGTAPEHLEYLATDINDPRSAFISTLCNALGDCGSIVVYHQQFESQRLCELASWLPEFSGTDRKNPAAALGLAVDHPRPRLPSRIWRLILAQIGAPCARARTQAIEGMQIISGQDAGLAWESLVRGSLDSTERDRVRALLDYCGQDTLALARLFQCTHQDYRFGSIPLSQGAGSTSRAFLPLSAVLLPILLAAAAPKHRCTLLRHACSGYFSSISLRSCLNFLVAFCSDRVRITSMPAKVTTCSPLTFVKRCKSPWINDIFKARVPPLAGFAAATFSAENRRWESTTLRGGDG